MLTDIDVVLREATHRLRFDPELRLEVDRELRSHYADKVQEYRAAGLDENHASADAVTALGDPTELGDQLWRANRARMTRRAIGRWIATKLLVPAACAVFILVFLDLLHSAAPLAAMIWWRHEGSQSPRPTALFEMAVRETKRQIGSAAIESGGSISAEIALGPAFYDKDTFKKELAAAKAVSEAHPQDAAFLVEYARLAVRLFVPVDAASHPDLMAKSELDNALRVIARGEQVDPQNAIFPLLAAHCLARASSRQLRNQPASYFPIPETYNDGSIHTAGAWKLQIEDAGLFARAIESFRRAAALPRYDDYYARLRDARLAALPNRNDLGSFILRTNADRFSAGWNFWICDLLSSFSAHALDVAMAGDHSEALRLEADINRVAGLTGSCGVIYPERIARYTAAVLQTAGQNQQAHALQAWATDFMQRWWLVVRPLVSSRDKFSGRRSVAINSAGLQVTWLPFNIESFSRAEYSLSDRVALLGLIEMLLGVIVVATTAAAIENALTGRRSDVAFVILPQPREAALLVLSFVLPIALYVGYVMIAPMGQRFRAFNLRYLTLTAEYGVVVVTSVAISLLMVAQISRRHLAAVGTIATGFASFVPAAIVVLPATVAVLSTSTLLFALKDVSPLICAEMIVLLLAIFLALRLSRARQSKGADNGVRVAGTLFRTIAVMTAFLTLLVGLTGGVVLHYVEATAIQQIQRDAQIKSTPALEALRREVNARSAEVAADCHAAMAAPIPTP